MGCAPQSHAPSSLRPARSAPAAYVPPWPASLNAWLRPNTLASCLALVHTHCVRVHLFLQLSRTSSHHKAALARAASPGGHVTQRAVLRSGCATVRSRARARQLARPGSLAAKPVVVQNGRPVHPCTASVPRSLRGSGQRPARCASARHPWLAPRRLNRCAVQADRNRSLLIGRIPVRAKQAAKEKPLQPSAARRTKVPQGNFYPRGTCVQRRCARQPAPHQAKTPTGTIAHVGPNCLCLCRQ